MSITKEQRAYRAMVARWGPLEIRRLHRRCPECRRVTLYCGERRFCGETGQVVCVTSVCITCGWVGSSDGSEP